MNVSLLQVLCEKKYFESHMSIYFTNVQVCVGILRKIPK